MTAFLEKKLDLLALRLFFSLEVPQGEEVSKYGVVSSSQPLLLIIDKGLVCSKANQGQHIATVVQDIETARRRRSASSNLEGFYQSDQIFWPRERLVDLDGPNSSFDQKNDFSI